MKAFILCSNKHDIFSSIYDLMSELRSVDVIPLLVENYEEIWQQVEDDEKYLFFRNPYVRIDRLADIVDFYKRNNFSVIYDSKREVIGFTKSQNVADFTVNQSLITYKKPDYSDPLHVLIYAHERADYFKLSLNSLLYSMNEVENVYIFLSQPSDEVVNIAIRAAERYPSIQIFRTYENVGISVINLFLQIVRPKKFVMFEEDFILPQHTKFVLPFWIQQFSSRLDSFDVVDFQTSIENQCFDFYRSSLHETKKVVSYPFQHNWTYNIDSSVQLTGNGLAVKTDSYIRGNFTEPNYIKGDGQLFEESKKVSISSIKGYHIGWNQEMDGFPQIGNWSRWPKPPKVEQEVIDCKTGQKHTLNLKQLQAKFG